MSLVDKVEHYKERYASVRDSYKDVVKQLKTNREYVQRLEFENRKLKRDVEVLNDEIRFLHSTKLSEDRKNKIVNSLVARSKASTEHPMLDIVLYSVCEYFEVTKGELQSKKRSRKLYLPRQVAHYLLSDRFAGLYIPLTAIGDKIGCVNHATVIHSRKKVKDLMEFDKVLYNTVQELETICINRYEEYKVKAKAESGENS